MSFSSDLEIEDIELEKISEDDDLYTIIYNVLLDTKDKKLDCCSFKKREKLINQLIDKNDNTIRDNYLKLNEKLVDSTTSTDGINCDIYNNETTPLKITNIEHLKKIIEELKKNEEQTTINWHILDTIYDILSKMDKILCKDLYENIKKILIVYFKFHIDINSLLELETSEIEYNKYEEYVNSCDKYKSINFLVYLLCKKQYISVNELEQNIADTSKTFLDLISVI